MSAGARRGWANRWTALVLLAAVTAIIAMVSHDFLAMRVDPPIFPGAGVSDVVKLSAYFPGIAGTPVDTDVYVLRGDPSGGSALVLGGTHPNEPAAFLAAVTLIEHAEVSVGTLYVIPRADRSGFTATEPQEGYPEYYHIVTSSGVRAFRYGSRGTNPVDQWPDPVIYINAAGQSLAGAEVRNLNRSYPGNPNGNLTEKLAYAIVELIRKAEIGIAVDLHEASPEYPVINAIVAHEDALSIAVEASLYLEFEGVQIGVERSPENLRGLSHREWGDATDTLALLVESANPAQGRLRGRTDEALIVEGMDPYYQRAAKQGLLYVPFGDEGQPIDVRVGRHLQTLQSLWSVYSQYHPQEEIVVMDVPSLADVVRDGLGAYLAPPPTAAGV